MRPYLILFGLVVAAGCTERRLPASSFQEVTGTVIAAELDARSDAFVLDSISGAGFAYAAGRSGPRNTWAVASGIINPGTLPAPPISGLATYDTEYEFFEVVSTDNFKSGTLNSVNGTITLTANFDAATLGGSSFGSVTVIVDSTISKDAFDGTFKYTAPGQKPVEAVLEGEIGPKQLVGVFEGNTGSVSIAGGLLGNLSP